MKNNYGINEDSFKEIISLFESIEHLKKVYIFGSRDKKESDIDFTIENDKDIKLRLLNKLEDIRCI